VEDDPVPCTESFIIRDSRDAVRRVMDLERRRRQQMRRHTEDPSAPPPPPAEEVTWGVHDFTTLYPSLPHRYIIQAVHAMVDEAFEMHERSRGSTCWLGVEPRLHTCDWNTGTQRDGSAQRERPTDRSAWKYFTAAEIKADITFILEHTFVTVGDHVYKQTCGVPMGLSCSPMLAVIMLAYYEINQLRRMCRAAQSPLGTQIDTPEGKRSLSVQVRRDHLDLAARFSRCCRAIDDVLMINLSESEQEWLLKQTYPDALQLSKECGSPGRIQYLDMEIRHDRGGFHTVLYDKRDALRLKGKMDAVRRFPHPESQLSEQCKYACMTTFMHRAHRVCTRRKAFIRAVATRASEMIVDGYSRSKIVARVTRFVDTFVSPAHVRPYIKAAIARAMAQGKR
jgi:hypothetical protein